MNLRSINSNMVGGVVRAFLPVIVGYCVFKGYLPAGDYGQLVTLAVTLSVAAWSVYTNQSGTVIK